MSVISKQIENKSRRDFSQDSNSNKNLTSKRSDWDDLSPSRKITRKVLGPLNFNFQNSTRMSHQTLKSSNIDFKESHETIKMKAKCRKSSQPETNNLKKSHSKGSKFEKSKICEYL